MKKWFALVSIVFFTVSLTPVFAQQPGPEVRFSNGNFNTGANISKQTFKKEDIQPSLFANKYFVLVSFSVLPGEQSQLQLRKAGIELVSYVNNNAYLASIKSSFNFSTAAGLGITSINDIPVVYKIDPLLSGNSFLQNKKDDIKLIGVTYFSSFSREAVQTELTKAGAAIVPTKFDAINVIFIQAQPSVIKVIAALPFVSYISLQSIKDKAVNYNTVAANGVSGLNADAGKNLKGRGVVMGIGDNSDISTHIDLSGRVIGRTPWVPQDHGTHVSGTAAGAGIIDVRYHGMAPKATIINQYFSDIITNAPVYVADNNMVLTNNSYYSTDAGCAGNGKYDILSNFADVQLNKYDQLLHVVASGNDGSLTCSPFSSPYATIKSGWQSAKNVLTVGAANTEDYTLSFFSSSGPTEDGRIKPEITSGGWAVISTNTYNTYGTNWGTSMAAPGVTGSLALMYERYRILHAGANPKATLMKAIACNTAEDLGKPGPDYSFGFGMINARRAVAAIENNRYIINTVANSATTTHNISLPKNARRLKIMLYWADKEAAVNTTATLVNDLDLTVTEPSAKVHKPYILNPLPFAVTANAVEGNDHTNNIEQVIIENPVAGNYAIKVNGFAVPFGPQEYVITYEIVDSSVTVEYPFGGETLVPGDAEVIRWDAYGNENNSFTIEYSTNNGNDWTLINNNVPAASRSYAWTVPASVTNTALIRISRNGTGLADQSDFNFSVLGRPIVTASNICEGSVQLSWPTITGATSYDVMQYSGDSMAVIGNTTAATFLVYGLDKTKTYWMGVRAKNGTVAGRRSVSVKVTPGSGTCSLPVFNNDLKVDTILAPNSARQYFSNEANATQPVKILVRNMGTVPTSGPFNVSYSYLNTVVTETVNTTIAANGAYTYSFTTPYTIVPQGFRYDFKAWVTHPSDNNHQNDTAFKTVKFINNDPITTLPFSEGFESLPAAEYLKAELAIGEDKYLDFSTNDAKGRARSFINTGFARTGIRAITLDQFPYTETSVTDSLTLNYNLQLFPASQLRFDFYYRNHGQADSSGNKVWIRGSETSLWIQAYDLFANQGGLGEWKHAVININDVLGSAIPAQAVTKTFQVRLGQEGNTSTNTLEPLIDIDDGYTFDDLTLNEAFNDVAVTSIVSPTRKGCSLTAANPITISIKNYNSSTANNVSVSYQVNNGTIITESINTIAANQTLNYTFVQKADLSAFIDHDIRVWVKYAGDSYPANDSILDFSVHNSPVINSYPYLQSFEINDGFYYTKGANSTWEWGIPAKPIINKAANGAKAWVTSLTGDYNNNETSYLYSPCFDLAGLSKPVLSFSHIFDIELDYDYAWVEYSTDGITWHKLGATGSGTNWYDNATLQNWRTSKEKWHVASIDIPVTGTVSFRFVMSSDGGLTMEGIGIDDIRVHEKIDIAEGPLGLFPAIVSANWGNEWIRFTRGDALLGPYYILGEINAHGQDLGTVTITPYLNSGAVRSSNNQYYLNRNYVIRTTKPPTGNVGVRLYFKDSEAEALINATTCTGCGKPKDAYELGLTKYNGTEANENGTLDDDSTGFFELVLPAVTDIIPHGDGYYAEFAVNSFSEFWLSKAIITPQSNNICPGSVITYTASTGGSTYQWQEDNGTGYTNITNGGNYAGATTNTLRLTGLPTSHTGYKYRCVVNGVNGNDIILRFISVWDGSAGTDWFTATNWSCGVVPDQYTDVVIPGGMVNNPVVNTNTAVRSITVQPGAPVTVSPGVNLTIKGQ